MSARRPECPVGGCDNEREVGHVMCKPCWLTVPKAIRDAVWRTYKAYGAWDDRAVNARERALQAAENALAEARVRAS